MTTRGGREADAALRGQARVWQMICAFVDSVALKCAVELNVADVINSHGGPISLRQIASRLDSTAPDVASLARIMNLLVRKGIFTADSHSDGGETLYGMTPSSRWILRDAELSLAPMVHIMNHPLVARPWKWFGNCIREGGVAFQKANGLQIWDVASADPEFNSTFNDGLACTARIAMKAVLSGYSAGFASVSSIVDVGGGTGYALAEVVKAYPHVKAINFDLPHVVAMAPAFAGVCHMGGDMFKGIPKADAIFMKSIMHDWGDEDCLRILRNCRRAIPEKTGKLVIVDVVVQPDGEGALDETRLVFDLVMLALTSGGKERTEAEWKRLLEEGGFPRYKIIHIPALQSIIEAYPA